MHASMEDIQYPIPCVGTSASLVNDGLAKPPSPLRPEEEGVNIDSGREVDQSEQLSEMEQKELDTAAGLNRVFDPMPPYSTAGEYKNELNVPVSTEAALHFGYAFGLHAKTIRQIDKSCALPIIEKKWTQSFPDERRFTWKNLNAKNVLGKGGFGTVLSADFLDGTVALKQFKAEARASEIWRERDMLIHLRNKRVVNMMGAFYDRGAYLVMEHCYGSLTHMVNLITPRQKLRFTIHLLEGLCFIHSKGIIHCDIRPDNCLITKRNTLVLADFGNAQLLPNGKKFVRAKERMLSNPGFSDFYSCVGGIYSESSDLFGAACCIFLMDKGRNLSLYETDNLKEKDAIVEYGRVAREGRLLRGPGEPGYDANGKRTPLIQIVQDSVYYPILKEMVKDKYNRASAEVLLYHPFFEQIKKQLKVTDAEIESDNEVIHLYDKVDLTKGFYAYENNPVLAITLQMMYYDEDKDPNLKESSSEKLPFELPMTRAVRALTMKRPLEFQAIPLDTIKEKLEMFLLENSIKVTAATGTADCKNVTAEDRHHGAKYDEAAFSRINLSIGSPDGLLDPHECPVIPLSSTDAILMAPPEPKEKVDKAMTSSNIHEIKMAASEEMAPPPKPIRPTVIVKRKASNSKENDICSPTVPVQINIHAHKTARNSSVPNKKARTYDSPPPKEIQKGVGGKNRGPSIKKANKIDEEEENFNATPTPKPVNKPKDPAASVMSNIGLNKCKKKAPETAVVATRTSGPACKKALTNRQATKCPPTTKIATSPRAPPKSVAKSHSTVVTAKKCDNQIKDAPKEVSLPVKSKSYRCIPQCDFTSKNQVEVVDHKQQCAIWWKIKGEPRQKQMQEEEKKKPNQIK